MLIVDSIIYFLFAFFIDNLVISENFQKLKPLLLYLKPSYWPLRNNDKTDAVEGAKKKLSEKQNENYETADPALEDKLVLRQATIIINYALLSDIARVFRLIGLSSVHVKFHAGWILALKKERLTTSLTILKLKKHSYGF